MASALQQEFEYYLQHQAEMVSDFDGKYIVLKNCRVIGVYDSELVAVTESEKLHERGSFLVQKVGRGNDAYTQTFHSRVAFSLENEQFQ